MNSKRPKPTCHANVRALREAVDMDDEEGRCLLDVICDPQALNDFLHGSDKIDSDDLLDTAGDAANAFFVGTGLHVQEASSNNLNTEQNQPTASVVLDFLEDDILGSPTGGSGGLSNSDQPCDILQQSLQEANITEQTLEAEAELDLGSFQLPTLQPVVQTASDGTQQIFSSGAELMGLQQSAVLAHQALVQHSVGADVVNKAISVQPFLQQVGLGNVTIQPISNLQSLPNGSPGSTLGIGQIQVVGPQVMTLNQSTQQLLGKPVQQTQVATMPVGSYLTQTAPDQQQVTLSSTGVSPQNTGLVIQKNLPTVATTTLNGNPMFGTMSAAQCTQSMTVTTSLSSPLMQGPNVIIHRTPTPIQPKPTGVVQQKLFQITPKPFGNNNPTLTIQNEAALQQQKAQQNLTFMTGKPGQNVVLSGFPQGLPANMFKQPSLQQQALSKPMSLHLLNQGNSIVIPAQHLNQAMLQGQNQFLLPGQLTSTSTVQQLSALQANMGGQILTTSHPSGHIITSQGPGGHLINQPMPSHQILTNQSIAGHLNLGQVLASQNAHGTAHILSTPIHLQPGQVGQPALFQMPVSLAGSLSTQSQPSVTGSLPTGTLNQSGQTVIQGVGLNNSQAAMLNAAENLNQAVSIQSSDNSSQSPRLMSQQQPEQSVSSATMLQGSEQPSMLTVQADSQSQVPPQLQLNVQHPPSQIPASQSSPTIAHSPDKIILSQTGTGTILSPESMQMFLQQERSQQQQFYTATLKMHQERIPNQSAVSLQLSQPIYSTATTSLGTTSSVPASVIVSSSIGTAQQPHTSRELTQAQSLATDSKVPNLIPQFPSGQQPHQLPTGQQKLPGASPSHSLPHPPMGESPQLQPTHPTQIQSPHQSRPPSQPQPLSRPPSQPHSRPPSQPQTLPRPSSEPLSRSCTPQMQMQNLFVVQNQMASSPHSTTQHPLRPPSQPQVQPSFQHHPLQPDAQPQLSSPPHMQFQVQLATHIQSQAETHARMQPQLQPSEGPPHTLQLQFSTQHQFKPQATMQTIHLTAEQQRNFQAAANQFHALSAITTSAPQQKQLLERFQQVQQSIILQAKQQNQLQQQQQQQQHLHQQQHQHQHHQQPSTNQPSPVFSHFTSQPSSVLVSNQGQQITVMTQAPLHGQGPGQAQLPTAGPAEIGKGSSEGGGGQQVQLASLLQQQQQNSVLVKSNSTCIATSADGKGFHSSGLVTTSKLITAQGKPGSTLPVTQLGQGTPGVISSVAGLGKGPLQIHAGNKVMPQIQPAPAQPHTQLQYESKLGCLKKPPTLMPPSKEACFLEQLHKHQGAVLHPDYKTSFHSFEDAFHRLLPYHVYQGMVPSSQDCKKVNEEFEVVSTQLLKRTQAMLNKYRLLLLDESRRVSPSAEMVMIDRMFIQEEKVALSQDKQLAKEKPDEYVSSSSRSLNFASPLTPQSASNSVPLTEHLKSPPLQSATQINPTKLVIKHGGGSPSVTWAKSSPSMDADEDAMPSRNRPPIKTYEARSRIGLKLKIKQEAGLSKVVHNTALDPIHQPTPPVCTVIRTVSQPSSATTTIAACPLQVGTATAGQMNGSLDHSTPAPIEKKPTAPYCRLPLRKTYRENVDAFVTEKVSESFPRAPVRPPTTLLIKQEDGSRSVITSHGSPNLLAEKSRAEEVSRIRFFNRAESRTLAMQCSPAAKPGDSSSGLMKELAEVQDDCCNRMIKQEPPDHAPAHELTWEVPLPPAKRRKSDSFDVDNASFSSDSPQDDTLNEHLQSAIDSILNLQQPQTGGPTVRTPSSYNSSSSPFSSPVHRTDSYLAPSHNGSLSARTLNR
ncbi:BRD4-interacting chromatin-remodeling complex-associated protein isoform X2 [Ambystoma mexicanum]|uniref:BRD4-interacting chromatin-remodeling complex-associated protein isoform X2 n=1 Tax=Ambystoma mexicanum TaxID=8296 RepID=UPI0037E985E2